MRPRSFVSLLIASLVIAGCSRGPSTDHAASAPADSTARIDVLAAGGPVVMPASGVELSMRLHAPGARATVLNVWATWCAPCREEFPGMLEVARRHRDVRLVLVSADFAEQLPEVRRFLAQHGVTDTTYLKSGGDQEFIDALDRSWTGALPATLVCDANGRTVAFWEGAASPERFEAAITKALHPNSQGATP